MAVDLGAIANMHQMKAEKKTADSRKFTEMLKGAFSQIDANNKAVTATEAGTLDTYLKTLSYY